MPTPPAKLVVLTPYTGAIDPGCERGGRHSRAAPGPRAVAVGFSAIDFGRTVLANTALCGGFEEILWIDSDIIFGPDDVEKLRGHQLPIAAAADRALRDAARKSIR